MGLRVLGTRQDTWVIRVHLDGAALGIWDKKSGGELDSDDTKYYPGGMVPPIYLGGKKTTGNVTLQRNYDLADDHDKINAMFAAVGFGKCTVTQRPMDQLGNEYGRSITYVGKLKRVTVPETDSEAQNAAAMVEIEVAIDGLPVAA